MSGPVQIGDLVGADVTITGTPFNGSDGAYLWNSQWGLLGVLSNGTRDSTIELVSGVAPLTPPVTALLARTRLRWCSFERHF